MVDIQQLVQGSAAAFAAGGSLAGWQSALAAALVASAMLLTFIYILGVLLRNQNTINFVKFELHELFMSAILVGLIISAVSVMSSLKVGFIIPHAEPTTTSHVDVNSGLYNATQQYYIDTGSMITGWMTTDYLFGIWIDNLASTTPYSRPLGVGIVAAPLAGFASPLKQILYNVNTALSIAYIINTAQRIVFEFSVYGFLNFYFPLGIILRSFTPTRRVGGALIAVGLGFLFILPFVTIINSQIVMTANSPTIGLNDALWGVDGNSGLLHDFVPSLRRSLSPAGQAGGFTDFLWNMTFGLLLNIGSLFQTFVGEMFAYAFLVPLSIVGIAFAVGYLLPALNILILVQCVKFMSRSLGEEIDITTLTRMV